MIALLVTLVVIGFILYLIQLAPLDATIKRIIQAFALLIVILWVLRSFLPFAGLRRW